jgi:hypothetical protein
VEIPSGNHSVVETLEFADTVLTNVFDKLAPDIQTLRENVFLKEPIILVGEPRLGSPGVRRGEPQATLLALRFPLTPSSVAPSVAPDLNLIFLLI